jgi:hypothetical protein
MNFTKYYCRDVSRVGQSVQWLATDWPTEVWAPTEEEDFPSTLCA